MIKDDGNAALEHVVVRFRVDSDTTGEAHCIVFTERGGLFCRKKRYCYDIRGKKIEFEEPRQRRDFLCGGWHCSLEDAIKHYRNCEEGKFKVTFEKITL